MVIGHCTYHIKKGHARDFVQEVQSSGFYEDSRNEPGNVYYIPYYSAEDPDVVFVTECWQTYEDIRLHEKAPHLVKLNEVCAKYLISVTLAYHETGKEYDVVTLTPKDM